MQIEIIRLRRDGGTQIRQGVSQETINDYAEKMRAGVVFPPVIAFYDGTAYWLADGFQRSSARLESGFPTIDVDVRPGTQRDAVLFACGANAEHGLRRTNEDKRRAVETLLADPEWSRKNATWIADKCKVSGQWVGRIIKEREPVHLDRRVECRDGKTRPAKKSRKMRPGSSESSEASRLSVDAHAMQDGINPEPPDFLPECLDDLYETAFRLVSEPVANGEPARTPSRCLMSEIYGAVEVAAKVWRARDFGDEQRFFECLATYATLRRDGRLDPKRG